MKTEHIENNCSCALFESERGSSEYYILIRSGMNRSYPDSLKSVSSYINNVYKTYGLSKETHIFSRFFLSDIGNQKDLLTGSIALELLQESACSFIHQPSLTRDDLVLLLYHIKSRSRIIKSNRIFDGVLNALTISGNDYSLHYVCNLHANNSCNPYDQTKDILDLYTECLAQNSMSLGDNTMRTWLYVNDIDKNYKGMVDARRDFFKKYGLTKNTHYIASTGVEAKLADANTLVSLDALSIMNIRREQVTYLKALQHLNPAHEYGSTFERGTRIVFGDREHFYLSGTASINRYGEVVHPGDIEKQTIRTIDNINALLSPYDSTINDLAYLIIYIRNMNHYGFVEEIIKERVDKSVLPIYVNAAICRTSWLVEIEGFGIIPCSADFPVFL